MTFKLHTETPSNEDLIDGNIHQRIASKIAETLIRDDVNIVGINGPLGSGKSTVINLLTKDINLESFHFINYDAELYQQGSTKKALITKIYEGIAPRVPNELKSLLENHKDDALGNNVTYKKTQDSQISTWAVIFIASLFICSQSIRPLHTEIIRNDKDFSFLLVLFLSALVSSPLILGASFIIRSYWDKSLKIGNIIKRNSVDVITEKMLISKEVGSIELNNAISGFKQCIPPGVNFLLVIDNLDRISPEKVKELWSDIELISSSSEKRLKLLIPYSSEHVAKALSSDAYEGKEFISKRIPVTFQIPQILSAGWRNVFTHYWKQSFPNESENLNHDAAELVEIWLPKNHLPITPRYLKKLINDIQITSISTPYEVKNIACTYYILTTRHNEIPFDRLLIENHNDSTFDEVTKEKFSKSIRKLQRIYGNNRQNWIDELLCINYQASPTLAQGELIDEPLKVALKQSNPDELLRVSEIFGFLSSWRRVIDDTDPTDWFVTLSNLPESKNNLIEEILPEVIKSIDSMDIRNLIAIENKSFLASLLELKRRKVNINGHYINALVELISSNITEMTSLPDDKLLDLGINNADIQNVLSRSNLLSKIVDRNILKEVYPLPKSIFYIMNLRNKQELLPELNIADYRLEPRDFIHGLDFAYFNNINIGLTDPDINKHATFENEAINYFLENGSNHGLENIYSHFVNNTNQINLLSFEMLVLTTQWHTSNITSYYIRNINSSVEFKMYYLAHCMSNMISSKSISSLENYVQFISDKDKFTYILSCYIKYVNDFSKITSALLNETLNEFLIPSLELIAKEQSLKTSSQGHLISDGFPILKNYLSDFFLDSIITQNDEDLRKTIEGLYIKSIDNSFINYVTSNALHNELSDFLFVCLQDEVDTQEKFNNLSNDDLHQHASIIKYGIGTKKTFSSIRNFIAPFYENFQINALDKEIPRLVYSGLSNNDKSAVSLKLSDLIYRRDIDAHRKIVIIKHFSDSVNYSDGDVQSGTRIISRLFLETAELPFIASWLDNQDINFNKWNNEDKKIAVDVIANNTKLFPRLKEKNPVKNRLIDISNDKG